MNEIELKKFYEDFELIVSRTYMLDEEHKNRCFKVYKLLPIEDLYKIVQIIQKYEKNFCLYTKKENLNKEEKKDKEEYLKDIEDIFDKIF